MADNYDFCIVQADAARRSADAAQLDNVRENFERAEKVWRSLADKAQRVADARQVREEATARASDAAHEAANDAANAAANDSENIATLAACTN